jgi:hypothetical protein
VVLIALLLVINLLAATLTDRWLPRGALHP